MASYKASDKVHSAYAGKVKTTPSFHECAAFDGSQISQSSSK